MDRSWPLAALLGAVLLAPAPALAAENLPGPPGITQQDTAQGPLDDMAFEGELAPADNLSNGRADTLYFRDGHFWSAACVPCGFKPGRYWVYRTAEGIHFRGELSSPTGGTFQYSGVVQDGHISVKVDWQKERWYWTVNREFRFEGTLDGAPDSFATLDNAKAGAVAALRSGETCEPV